MRKSQPTQRRSVNQVERAGDKRHPPHNAPMTPAATSQATGSRKTPRSPAHRRNQSPLLGGAQRNSSCAAVRRYTSLPRATEAADEAALD